MRLTWGEKSMYLFKIKDSSLQKLHFSKRFQQPNLMTFLNKHHKLVVYFLIFSSIQFDNIPACSGWWCPSAISPSPGSALYM